MSLKLPENWGKYWGEEQAARATAIMNNIRFELAGTQYMPKFMAWSTDVSDDGAFISFGLKKKGNQENGNGFSTLFNFGFHYKEAIVWPEGYIEEMIPNVISVYENFIRDNQIEAFRHTVSSVDAGCSARDIVREIDPLS